MFNSIIVNGLTVSAVFICIGISLVCGILIAVSYAIRSRYTKNFLISLILLPAIVQTVIMMVNGNIGTGVAVMGAFSLVRFRSVPGNSKEICCIFFAMAAGLATGIGMVWFALVFTAVVCAVFILLKVLPLFTEKQKLERDLRITVPEDLNYESELSPVLGKYTKSSSVLRVKTSDMGSLYVITYRIRLLSADQEKQLIDELRVINSNLPIVCTSNTGDADEL